MCIRDRENTIHIPQLFIYLFKSMPNTAYGCIVAETQVQLCIHWKLEKNNKVKFPINDCVYFDISIFIENHMT